MLTPKTSSSEGVQRISPHSVSSYTTQRSCACQLKTTGLEPNSSAGQPIRTSKITSPRLIDRTSSRGPVPEKKRLGRVSELVTQVTQLENALRTVKDQLIVSESWKRQAKLDAEESRKELLAMSLKLEESQKLLARSSSEQIDHKPIFPQELQDQHASTLADSAALSAALLEIDQLKVKLDTITESEATQKKRSESAYAEIQFLKDYMAETLSVMEEMKSQLEDCKSSESQAQALAAETLLQLETAKKTMESRTDEHEYKAILLELDQSRARVRSLEGIISKMKTDRKSESQDITALKSELGKIKSADIEITAELKKSKAEIEELKANLMDKETELQCILEENEDLNAKLATLILGKQEKEESKQDFNSIKSKLMSLKTELCEKWDENEKLKLEMKKMKGAMEASKQEFNGLKLKLRILEKELCEKSDEMKKMEGVREAITKSNERLEETEEELRRVKVQMGQWRKAAEAATAMLCEEKSENNGRMVVERTWSMGHYGPSRRMNIGSPCSVDIYDDDEGELLKRGHGNMLKRIRVLWKKPQNK